jgi:hypothetical protein
VKTCCFSFWQWYERMVWKVEVFGFHTLEIALAITPRPCPSQEWPTSIQVVQANITKWCRNIKVWPLSQDNSEGPIYLQSYLWSQWRLFLGSITVQTSPSGQCCCVVHHTTFLTKYPAHKILSHRLLPKESKYPLNWDVKLLIHTRYFVWVCVCYNIQNTHNVFLPIWGLFCFISNFYRKTSVFNFVGVSLMNFLFCV